MSRRPARKAFVRGTQRLVSPAETLARVLPYVRAMGITRIADVTGLDFVGIPVVMVCRPNGRSISVAQASGRGRGACPSMGTRIRARGSADRTETSDLSTRHFHAAATAGPTTGPHGPRPCMFPTFVAGHGRRRDLARRPSPTGTRHGGWIPRRTWDRFPI